jgi:hypothetical protein
MILLHSGSFLVPVVACTACCAIALTWAGNIHPWSSADVLVPLTLGVAGLVFFFVYEAMWANNPIVPMKLFAACTALAGWAFSIRRSEDVGFTNASHYTGILPAFFTVSLHWL